MWRQYQRPVHNHKVSKLSVIISPGAGPPPLPLRVGKAGRNHLNEEITPPPLPTAIGERYSQTISNLGLAALLCRCELPPLNESAEITGALYLIHYSENYTYRRRCQLPSKPRRRRAAAHAPPRSQTTSVKVRNHRLNMELDLQSLFGLHVHSCTHLLRPRNSPPPLALPPAFGLIYESPFGQPR